MQLPSVEPANVTTSRSVPLPRTTRREMEARLNHDFGHVRVHTDSHAAAGAAQLGAAAYTIGPHIAFGAGRFEPASEAGRELLAHELTHVVQQRGAPAGGALRVSHPADPAETEADAVARSPSPHRIAQSMAPAISCRGDDDPAMRQWHPGRPLPYRQATQLSECLGTLGERNIAECEREVGVPEQYRNKTPPPAVVTESRPAVQAADEKMFTDLMRTLGELATKVRTLVKTGSPKEPWIAENNANIQELLALLAQLQTDLTARNFIVRFDQPANSNAAASYTSTEDVMHLKTFANDDEAVPIIADLVHEYAHIQQDRRVEAMIAGTTKATVHDREAELKQEIDARRAQTYFSRLLIALGIGDFGFHEEVNERVFVGRFERERTGKKAAAERVAATKEIREEIGTAYAGQLASNAPGLIYRIEISDNSHALLYAAGTPVDLGAISSALTTRQQLEGDLAGKVSGLPDFARLFPKQKGAAVKYATFHIFYGAKRLGEFSLPPP